MTDAPDRARQRFAALTALRFAAALLVILGMAIATDSLDLVGPELALPVGSALFIVGMLDLMVIIPMLTRRWRSDRP